MKAWAAAGLKLDGRHKEHSQQQQQQQQGKSEKGWVRVGRVGGGDAEKERDGGSKERENSDTTSPGGLGAAAKRWSALVWRGWRADRSEERSNSSAKRNDDDDVDIFNNTLQIPAAPRGSARPLLPLPAESPFIASSATPPSLGRVDEEDITLPTTSSQRQPLSSKVPASAAVTAASLVPSPVPATTATAFTTNTPPPRSHGRLSLGFLQGFRGWSGSGGRAAS
ncbi:uncharacterized protein IWZ02DRAFT_447969 [Phyllosticta citriasiana]|uniref:uncharacterized protein n=1 Tax=Phyllosticta citriasiana TaxID=595635 RepID=UPI0030FDA8E5